MSRTRRKKLLRQQGSVIHDGHATYTAAIGTDGPFQRDACQPEHVASVRRRQMIKKAKSKTAVRLRALHAACAADPAVAAACFSSSCYQLQPTTRVRRGQVVVIPPEWRGWTTHGQTLSRRKREARLKRAGYDRGGRCTKQRQQERARRKRGE